MKPLCPNCEDVELVKHCNWRYDTWACPDCAFAEFDLFHNKTAA